MIGSRGEKVVGKEQRDHACLALRHDLRDVDPRALGLAVRLFVRLHPLEDLHGRIV